MPPNKTNDLPTTRLLGCQPLARPDGRVALLLSTDRLGAIALELNQQAIDALRLHLAAAEQFLRQPTEKN